MAKLNINIYKAFSGPQMLQFVAIYHIIVGYALCVALYEAKTPVISAIYKSLGLSAFYEGVALIISSALMFSGLYLVKKNQWASLLMIPQQYLLCVSAWDRAYAIWIWAYPDGYVPCEGARFVFADQVAYIMICAWHAVALGKFYINSREWTR